MSAVAVPSPDGIRYTADIDVGGTFTDGFFTDGISEMMNHEHDCFGEGRLGELAGVYRDRGEYLVDVVHRDIDKPPRKA